MRDIAEIDGRDRFGMTKEESYKLKIGFCKAPFVLRYVGNVKGGQWYVCSSPYHRQVSGEAKNTYWGLFATTGKEPDLLQIEEEVRETPAIQNLGGKYSEMEEAHERSMKAYDKAAGLGKSKISTVKNLPIVLVAIAIGVLGYFLFGKQRG